jgi:hypothetical protein
VYREKLEIGIPTGFSFFRKRALKLETHLSIHKTQYLKRFSFITMNQAKFLIVVYRQKKPGQREM